MFFNDFFLLLKTIKSNIIFLIPKEGTIHRLRVFLIIQLKKEIILKIDILIRSKKRLLTAKDYLDLILFTKILKNKKTLTLSKI
ncbi:MAG: hypothetical protein WJU30_00057 [Candidatus Phytoplasma pruni]